MIEVRGREIRTSEIDTETHKSGEVFMKAGSTVEIRSDAPTCCSTEYKLNVNYRDFPRLVKPNDMLYVDDGKIALLVVEVTMEAVVCEVKQGGVLGSYKTVKLPSGKHEQMPILTIQDQEELMAMVQSSELHYVAIPYAVRKRDITSVKEALGTAYGAHVQLIAKIDTVESIHNFEELIKTADGIIINRVELSMEMQPEKIVLAQKWMIDRASQEGKPIFVQSQVLESMIKEVSAHRQDAEDVTSGVLEGIDAFILSHETSVGKYPVEATIQLAKCIAEGENILDYEQVYNDVRADAVNNAKKLTPADALATTACSIALENNVDMFICLTETGRIARYIAKYRPF